MNRRDTLALMAGTLAAGGIPAARAAESPSWASPEFDSPRPELVLELVVTCTKPEMVGGDKASKDGQRTTIWPIIGGTFVGKDIRGTVVPGGGDFPVIRPDGVTIIDALYRLKTDDGVTLLIHNKGLAIPGDTPAATRYRLSPDFTVPQGKYDWLNKGVFIANLTIRVPQNKRLAKSENENDRMIHVYRLA